MAQAGSNARISREAFAAGLNEILTGSDTHKTLSLLVIHIHHLRRINATSGYTVSRQVVNEFGARLESIARPIDQIHLIGDDEYAMILPSLQHPSNAVLAATKILNMMTAPFEIGDTLHRIKATVGVATWPDDADSGDRLLQCAELALVTAENSRAPYAVYADVPAKATVSSWEIEGELRDALDNSELEMYYQPQVDIASRRVCGAESLMRWNHPVRGLLSPELFIGVAERTGQIRPMTWSGLNMALQRASEWPRLETPLAVGVNVSATLLGESEFAELVRDALAIWGIGANRLTLEITETALMRRFDTSFATLKQLDSLGISISIDDFGTGYSSLGYFRDLPAKELKIDKTFVMKMVRSEKDRHIVESVIDLARKFKLRTVAEGVSDQATLNALQELGCDAAQGYYVGRPMRQSEFMEYLNVHREGWTAQESS